MNGLNPQPVATRFGGVAEVKVFARQLVESSVMELKGLQWDLKFEAAKKGEIHQQKGDFIEMQISSIKQKDQQTKLNKIEMISPARFVGTSNSGDLSGTTWGY